MGHVVGLPKKKPTKFDNGNEGGHNGTVQPKNNARARSDARSSCPARTRKPAQEVKVLCFCGLPARTFEMQEVENLAARSRKKLLMLPQAARRCKKYCGSSRRNL